MSFTEAVRTCFQKYITISGRARRSEFWWWALFVFLGNLVFGFLDSILFGGGGETGVGILGAIFSLVVLLPGICVAGRRLHDRDMSAWWLLLALIPVLGFLILLFFYVQRGTEGPNRFGPDPLNDEGPGGGSTYSDAPIPRSGGN